MLGVLSGVFAQLSEPILITVISDHIISATARQLC